MDHDLDNTSLWNRTFPNGSIYDPLLANTSTYPTGFHGVSPLSMRIVLWYMNLYMTPVIIFVGLVGNFISFLVFICTSQKHLSSSIYLAALAVADSGFLVQLLASWLVYVRIYIFHRYPYCQIFIYISYICSFLSVWLVVAFTVERFIVCSYPLLRNKMCTVRRAKIVVLCLSAFALVAYSYGAWSSGTVEDGHHPRCSILPQFIPMVQIFTNVDTFITFVVPVVAIIFMNVRIVYKIMYFQKKRLTMTTQKAPVSRNSSISEASLNSIVDHHSVLCQDGVTTLQRNAITSRNRSQIKITKMLLVVSSIFVVCNLPSHAVRVYDTFQRFIDDEYQSSESLELCQKGFMFLYYCNFSVNFFLYSLCGTNFRKALKSLAQSTWSQVITCCHGCQCVRPSRWRRSRRQNSGSRTSSYSIKFRSVFRGSNAETHVVDLQQEFPRDEDSLPDLPLPKSTITTDVLVQ